MPKAEKHSAPAAVAATPTSAAGALAAAAEPAAPRRSCCRLPSLFEGAVLLAIVIFSAFSAHRIRLYAIETYGRVIHEFDPWVREHGGPG